MKTLALFFAIGFVLLACKSDKIGPEPVNRTLKYQENISLEDYTMTFAEVEDSRCPANAFCITAGSAYVDLKFTRKEGSGPSQQVKLCLGDCTDLRKKGAAPESADVRLDKTTYRLKLLVVNPYPQGFGLPSEKEEYSLVLKIQTIP